MALIGVVFFHESDHPVVAEADLLELVLSEVIGLVLALAVLVDAVEAGLGELLALPPRPLLHNPVSVLVDGESRCRWRESEVRGRMGLGGNFWKGEMK